MSLQCKRQQTSVYLVEPCEGAQMRQMAQSSEKEMSCHTAGITHAARHRSLYSSVDLKWICTRIHMIRSSGNRLCFSDCHRFNGDNWIG